MMLMSDVLITSQSLFSYAAAVHSAGNAHAIDFCTHVTGSAAHILLFGMPRFARNFDAVDDQSVTLLF